MSSQINAVIVKDGVTTTIQVAERAVAPREIIQILEQKKKDLGFDYVQEVYTPQGHFGRPSWTGTAERDAVAMMKEISVGLPRRTAS
jgi:hypothetical protein